METQMNVIDTSGYSCPIPLAMISRKLKTIAVGDTLKVISDDSEFKKEIKIWSYETGNHIVDLKQKGDCYVSLIQKGSGFKGETIIEVAKFIGLGVKLHFIKAFLQVIPYKKIKYLISFVSVLAGSKANKWLQENGINGYTLLPIPNGITKHCGLVLGFSKKSDAIKIFKILEDEKFAVEDIYFEDKDKSYHILDFN
jgi:TusA-related sulfurtransferase